ncbi:MFS transporter [Cytobacillus sp. FJAT-54145]|uniref:MFS transporter n=1 Tax=Cytobacillus spartinae TaxID=3299023 RepID=A0ABW6K6X9_9BACI
MISIARQQKGVRAKEAQPSAWRNMNFMILLISGAIISFGSKIYELSLPLILYHYTNSPVVMSTMRGIEFLPNLLLAMFIGVLVDRANKRNWTLWTIFLQIVILLILYFSLQEGKPSLYLFYICGFLLMTFNYAFLNARMSMVKQALPNELLTSANASFNFIYTLIGIMGPTLTGLILMFSNLHSGLLLTAMAFIFSYFILLFLKTNEVIHEGKAGFWKELKEGWKELFHNKTLWTITILVIFINATAGMVDTTIIYFAKDQLHLSDIEIGMLLSTLGGGGLLGSLLVGKVRKKWPTYKVIVVSTLIIGITYLMMFMTESPIWFGVALLLNGISTTINSICVWTFRQESTPHHLIGRISGITGSLFKLAMPFAIFSAGWISELADPSIVFLLAWIGNMMLFLYFRLVKLWNTAM